MVSIRGELVRAKMVIKDYNKAKQNDEGLQDSSAVNLNSLRALPGLHLIGPGYYGAPGG